MQVFPLTHTAFEKHLTYDLFLEKSQTVLRHILNLEVLNVKVAAKYNVFDLKRMSIYYSFILVYHSICIKLFAAIVSRLTNACLHRNANQGHLRTIKTYIEKVNNIVRLQILRMRRELMKRLRIDATTIGENCCRFFTC